MTDYKVLTFDHCMGVNGILKQNFRSVGFIIIQFQSFKKFDSIILTYLYTNSKQDQSNPVFKICSKCTILEFI